MKIGFPSNFLDPEWKEGRPKNRWQDRLERDLKNIGVRKWKETAQDRKKWKGVVLEAKAHKEL